MTDERDTREPERPPAEAPAQPVLDPDEMTSLDGYLARLKAAPNVGLERLVVYGSKARDDGAPESDLDVPMLVGDGPDGVEKVLRVPRTRPPRKSCTRRCAPQEPRNGTTSS